MSLDLAAWEMFPLVFFLPLVFLQGFFSGSEMAIVTCNRIKIGELADRGSRSARLVLRLLENPERFLTITLLGTNICHISNTSLMTWFFIRRGIPMHPEVAILLFVWPTILVFAEILPKSFYRHHADRIAPIAAPIIHWLTVALRPVLALIAAYTGLVTKIFFGNREKPPLGATREELKRLIEKTDIRSDVNREESRLVTKMLDFGEHLVEEAMVPLIHVQAIEASSTIEEAITYIADVEHSRVPVFDERVDRIIGLLHAFDLLQISDPKSFVRSHMRETLFVPRTQRMDSLFSQMRSRGISMAIIVNEYGGAEGVVTIEDLVEVVVGDIADEFDVEAPVISQLGRDVYLLSGLTTIDEFNETLPVQIPEGNYDTVAGFLLEHFKYVPKRFEFLNLHGIQFTISNASERSIEQVHVRILDRTGTGFATPT
jgi:CBS domain containing-hemolysin-like protein